MATNRLPPSDLPRNPETYASYRREVLWQIWVPLGITIGILVLFVLLMLYTDRGTLEQWEGVATLLLAIPLMILGFIVLAIIIGSIVLITQFLPKVSPFMLRGQIFLYRVEVRVRKISDSLVEPVIRTRQNWARLGALRRDKQ